MFLVSYKNPVDGITPTQVYQIFEKTKSESERLETKLKQKLGDLHLSRENSENLAERFLRVTPRAEEISTNVILRDSAMEVVSLEQKFTAEQTRKILHRSNTGTVTDESLLYNPLIMQL